MLEIVQAPRINANISDFTTTMTIDGIKPNDIGTVYYLLVMMLPKSALNFCLTDRHRSQIEKKTRNPRYHQNLHWKFNKTLKQESRSETTCLFLEFIQGYVALSPRFRNALIRRDEGWQFIIPRLQEIAATSCILTSGEVRFDRNHRYWTTRFVKWKAFPCGSTSKTRKFKKMCMRNLV